LVGADNIDLQETIWSLSLYRRMKIEHKIRGGMFNGTPPMKAPTSLLAPFHFFIDNLLHGEGSRT